MFGIIFIRFYCYFSFSVHRLKQRLSLTAYEINFNNNNLHSNCLIWFDLSWFDRNCFHSDSVFMVTLTMTFTVKLLLYVSIRKHDEYYHSTFGHKPASILFNNICVYEMEFNIILAKCFALFQTLWLLVWKAHPVIRMIYILGVGCWDMKHESHNQKSIDLRTEWRLDVVERREQHFTLKSWNRFWFH